MPGSQLRAVDHLDAVAVTQVGRRQLLEAGDMGLGHVAYRGPELGHPVARQRVVDAGPVPAGGQQTRPGQGAEVVGGVGDALVDLAGDLLHRALALGEDIDDLGSPTAGQRLGHLGEALEQRVLGGAVTHHGHLTALRPAVNLQTNT